MESTEPWGRNAGQSSCARNLSSSWTRVRNPKRTWAGLAEALAVEIHDEARLAA